MTDYPTLFRDAYSLLHGEETKDVGATAGRSPDESAEAYLARSRSEAIGRTRNALAGATPPPALARAHEALLRLLAIAVEADEALAAQVHAYRCGQFDASMAHSDRLHGLVSESARLERELAVMLRDVGFPARARDEE